MAFLADPLAMSSDHLTRLLSFVSEHNWYYAEAPIESVTTTPVPTTHSDQGGHPTTLQDDLLSSPQPAGTFRNELGRLD